MKAEAVVFQGPPGVGKGTQAERVAKEGRIPYFGMSDIMRSKFRADPEFEVFAQSRMNKGLLLPDEITNGLWAEAVNKTPGYHDMIIDGYPRTVDQYNFLRNHLLTMGVLPVFVILRARYEVTNARRLARIEEMRSKGLEPRAEDLDEAVHRARFELFEKEFAPIFNEIRRNHSCHHFVNAERDKEDIFREVVSHFHLPHINVNVDEMTTA